jgi:hypothetical protein
LGSADDTFVVDSFDDLVEIDPVDVRCQTSAGACTLRAAVMQANFNSGDSTILLPAGIFQLSRQPNGANGADSGDLNLEKSSFAWITIVGAGAESTIVDGGDLDRIFRVELGTAASIRQLTVRNGSAGSGGGIRADGAIALAHVRIVDNVADFDGGGLYLDSASSSSLYFTDILGNQAGDIGGGLYLSANVTGVVSMNYVRIRDNVADFAGGLYHLGSGSLDLGRSLVSENRALAAGGLAFAETFAQVRVTSSTVAGNRATSPTAGFGGGIHNSSTLYLVNDTISGNSATVHGGGIFNLGNASLYNSTVAFNEADVDADPIGGTGGGIRNEPPGILAIRNSVLAGNYRSGTPVPDDCSGSLGSYGFNRLSSFAGCAITQTGGCGGMHRLLGSNSELGPLRYNGGVTPTHAIQAGSDLIDDVDPPCVCQNELASPIALDQRDGSRVVGARCDVGAFEFGALPAGSLFADGFESGSTWYWH